MAAVLRTHMAEYLRLRRALGHRLEDYERDLGSFCDWATAAGKTAFTTADVLAWACGPHDATRHQKGRRISMVRGLATYLVAVGLDVQVPPLGLLPAGEQRATPFIYSQADLDAVMDSCGQLFAPARGFVAQTMRTLIGLIAATGMRPGEARLLRIGDIDESAARITIHASKDSSVRTIPVHPSTIAAIATYRDLPARLATGPAPDGPLIVTRKGIAYRQMNNLDAYFRAACVKAGLLSRGLARPRLYDLRHTFATNHMAAAYRAGRDPERTLALLATWMGHSGVENTYWYLSATPELLALAAARLDEPRPS
jgi:integrase